MMFSHYKQKRDAMECFAKKILVKQEVWSVVYARQQYWASTRIMQGVWSFIGYKFLYHIFCIWSVV